MGWNPARMLGKEFLILSTQGGIRAPDGTPIALGYHTGHWEVGLLMEEAARTFSAAGAIPFAAYCSDPCDGRTNGTAGMLDSLAYRNDAAIVVSPVDPLAAHAARRAGHRHLRQGPARHAHGARRHPDLPTVLVPGGVTLLAEEAEDTGKVQTLATRFAGGEITLDHAARWAARPAVHPAAGASSWARPATSQVVAEALGLTLPHGAFNPSGAELWRDLARRSATRPDRPRKSAAPRVATC
jgi:dihydroxyacid dehydratase/phosphogluconate dehydratase